MLCSCWPLLLSGSRLEVDMEDMVVDMVGTEGTVDMGETAQPEGTERMGETEDMAGRAVFAACALRCTKER